VKQNQVSESDVPCTLQEIYVSEAYIMENKEGKQIIDLKT